MTTDIDPYDLTKVSPLIAAANLIGIITSNGALHDARINFTIWCGTAHSCMLSQKMTTPLKREAIANEQSDPNR